MQKFLQQEHGNWTQGQAQPDFPCARFAQPEPRGICHGGSSGSSQQSSQQTSTEASFQESEQASVPVNMQNAAETANVPTTVSALDSLASMLSGSASSNSLLQSFLSAYGGNFSAPVTTAQNTTLSNLASAELGNLSFNPTEQAALNSLTSELSPNFASSLATSPQTTAAIQAALQPITANFNAQTMPSIVGNAVSAGQRAVGGLSSAFGEAFTNAQAQEQATEASTAGSIANNAYQTGLNITANAPSQITALTSGEVTNLINTLNAQALPQQTEQLGINNALSTYQSAISSLLSALGLQVQGEQPVIGNESASESLSESESSSQGTSQGTSNFSSFNLGSLSALL